MSCPGPIVLSDTEEIVFFFFFSHHVAINVVQSVDPIIPPWSTGPHADVK